MSAPGQKTSSARRPGDQCGPDSGRPLHVAAGGQSPIPAIDARVIGSVGFRGCPVGARDRTIWSVGKGCQDSIEGVHEFDRGCRRQGQPTRDVYGRRLAALEGSVDELRDDTRAAQQDGYASAIKRGPDRLVGVKLPDVGVVDHAWLLGTVGHWKIPCAAWPRQSMQTDRGIVGTPEPAKRVDIRSAMPYLRPLRLHSALHPDPRHKAPSGPGWVHEIKHDGYRLQVRRDGDQVRLFTRRGYDWSGRYPAIAVTATLLRARSFTLDGEAVVCGPDGVAIFDALHRRGTVTEAMLYAFDLLELDGEDLRGLPLGDRKKRLARLLGGRRLGIVLSDHTDEDGATIFRHACRMGLEGIVSKRLTRALSVGPVAGLAQGEEPGQPGDDPGAGGGVVTRAAGV